MAKYALVIGICEYSRLDKLTKPTRDAERVAQILDRYGDYQVTRLPVYYDDQQGYEQVSNKPLAYRELATALEKFLTEQADGHEALIYFSGHGFVVTEMGDSESYLAASDCIVESEGQKIVSQQNGLPLTKLNKLIRKSNLSSLVVLLDCCNSGYFLERGSIEQTLTAFSPQRDYYLIAACRGFEVAYEGNDLSVFTDAMLRGLSPANVDKANQGRISGDRLFDFISNSLRNTGQEPIRMGWGRSIMLVKHPLPQPDLFGEGDSATPSVEQFATKGLSTSIKTFNPTSPYVGLQAFEREQASYFYGRERAVQILRVDFFKHTRFLAVVGPSGCGKSSLVKAGLLPELEQDCLPDGSQWLIETPFVPGEHPNETLREVLDRHSHSHQPLLLTIDQFEEVFTLCQEEAERQQFIEQIAAAITDLNHLIKVIITIRGDFLERFANNPKAAQLLNQPQPTTYIVPPLTLAELADAIARPALQNGVTFADGLVSRIAQDVLDRPGALPLLQYALAKLWQACITSSSSPVLTYEGYEQIGSVKGALNQQATELYNKLPHDDQTLVQQLFMALVKVEDDDGNEQKVVRRRASRKQLRIGSEEQLQRLINLLSGPNYRLIIADTKTVEVAHETLLSEWTLFQEWLAANRETILLRQRLERYCWEWQESGSDDVLLPASRLAVFEEWIEQTNSYLTEAEAEFIKRSVDRRDRTSRDEAERRHQAEVRRQRELKLARRTAFGAIAAAAIIAVTAGFAVSQWRTADRRQIEALVTASTATFALNRNSFDALLEGVQAGEQLQQSIWFRSNPQLQTEVMQILGQGVYWVREHNRLVGHTDEIESVSFSPDGKVIATASDDNTIKLWDLNGKVIQTLDNHIDTVKSVCFTPDGSRLMSASLDETVKIWSLDGTLIHSFETGNSVFAMSCSRDKIVTGDNQNQIKLWDFDGQLLETFSGHNGDIYGLTFSPDGKRIASASDDNTARVWDLNRNFIELRGHENAVFSVSFSPSDGAIATASVDGTVKLWDQNGNSLGDPFFSYPTGLLSVKFNPDGETLAVSSVDGVVKILQRTGEEITTLEGHLGYVNSISFSPNGQWLVSASNDQSAKLWQLTPYGATILPAHTRQVSDVEFSSDGQVFATGGYDKRVSLWDTDGKFLRPLAWHDDVVLTVAFSPGSHLIASGDRSGEVQVWHRNGNRQLTLPPQQNAQVNSVSFSADGRAIATVNEQGWVRLWDLTGQPILELPQQGSPVLSVSFSPDGEAIVTGNDNGIVKLWDWSGNQIGELTGHEAGVLDVSFSPDNRLIATASKDKTVRLWERYGDLLRTLTGHEAAISEVNFSPDSNMVATASDDRTIKIWRTDGTLITTLTGHRDEVNDVSFNLQHSNILASASTDRTVILWQLELTVDGMIKRGCDWLKSYLNSNPNAPSDVCEGTRFSN